MNTTVQKCSGEVKQTQVSRLFTTATRRLKNAACGIFLTLVRYRRGHNGQNEFFGLPVPLLFLLLQVDRAYKLIFPLFLILCSATVPAVSAFFPPSFASAAKSPSPSTTKFSSLENFVSASRQRKTNPPGRSEACSPNRFFPTDRLYYSVVRFHSCPFLAPLKLCIPL